MARLEARVEARRCIRIESRARLRLFLDAEEASLVVLEREKSTAFIVAELRGFRDILCLPEVEERLRKWAGSVAERIGVKPAEYRLVAVTRVRFAKIDAARLAQVRPRLGRLIGSLREGCAVITG